MWSLMRVMRSCVQAAVFLRPHVSCRALARTDRTVLPMDVGVDERTEHERRQLSPTPDWCVCVCARALTSVFQCT